MQKKLPQWPNWRKLLKVKFILLNYLAFYITLLTRQSFIYNSFYIIFAPMYLFWTNLNQWIVSNRWNFTTLTPVSRAPEVRSWGSETTLWWSYSRRCKNPVRLRYHSKECPSNESRAIDFIYQKGLWLVIKSELHYYEEVRSTLWRIVI